MNTSYIRGEVKRTKDKGYEHYISVETRPEFRNWIQLIEEERGNALNTYNKTN